MKNKIVDEVKKEVIPIAINYGSGFDFDHQEHATDDFIEGANYVINYYYSPLLARNEELEKCVRELVEALEENYEYSMNGGSGCLDILLNHTETALSNAKKLLANE